MKGLKFNIIAFFPKNQLQMGANIKMCMASVLLWLNNLKTMSIPILVIIWWLKHFFSQIFNMHFYPFINPTIRISWHMIADFSQTVRFLEKSSPLWSFSSKELHFEYQLDYVSITLKMAKNGRPWPWAFCWPNLKRP